MERKSKKRRFKRMENHWIIKFLFSKFNVEAEKRNLKIHFSLVKSKMYISFCEVEKNEKPEFLVSKEKILLETKEKNEVYQFNHTTFEEFVKDYFQAKHQCVQFTPPKTIFIKTIDHPLFVILEERFKNLKELENLEKVSFRFLDYFDFVLDSGNLEIQQKYVGKIKEIENSLEYFSKSHIDDLENKKKILEMKVPGKLYVNVFMNDDYEFEVRALGEPDKISIFKEQLAKEIVCEEEEEDEPH
jgi:hypothetical protein